MLNIHHIIRRCVLVAVAFTPFSPISNTVDRQAILPWLQ